MSQHKRVLDLALQHKSDARIMAELGVTRGCLCYMWRYIYKIEGTTDRNLILYRHATIRSANDER